MEFGEENHRGYMPFIASCRGHMIPSSDKTKTIHLNKLSAKCGARTPNPKIKTHMVYKLSEPGAPKRQVGSEFDVLYSKENSPWIGGVQLFTAIEHSSGEILGKSKCYRAPEAATQKWQDWLLGDFLVRLVGPAFKGQGS